MSNYELISFPSDAALAESAAERFLGELASAPRNSPYCVALSGGRIANRFFNAIVEKARSRSSNIDKVHWFWADERCVPPTDKESSFSVADQLLFQPLEIAPENIHRVRGEDDPESAARQAAEELRRVAPANRAGVPMLDLIFLGMGEDGHVASLFPGEPEEVMSSPEICRPVVAVKPPPNRVTVSYGVIAAARQVWALASGKGKEDALKESLKPDGATPLARVLRQRTNSVIFSDIRI